MVNGYVMGFYKEIPAPEGYEERKYLQFQIVEKINKKLEKKYHMTCVALGSSGDGCLLKAIDVSFERCKGSISLEENRKILFDCMQIYLAEFNKNQKIRRFLKNYPFEEKNVHITIHNCEKDGTTVFHPYIGTLHNLSKGISYYTYDPEDKYFKYKTEIDETYEEFYSKLKETKETQSKQSESTETKISEKI